MKTELVLFFIALFAYSIFGQSDNPSITFSVDSNSYATIINAIYEATVTAYNAKLVKRKPDTTINMINIVLPVELQIGSGDTTCKYFIDNSYLNIDNCQLNTINSQAVLQLSLPKDEFAAGTMFRFQFGPIKNPPCAFAGNPFTFSIEYFADITNYQATASFVYKPNLMRSISLAQSNQNVNTLNILYFTFQLNNNLPENGYLSLKIPSGIEIGTISANLTTYDSQNLILGVYVENPEKSIYKFTHASFSSGLPQSDTQSMILTVAGTKTPSSLTSISGFFLSTKNIAGNKINENNEATQPLSVKSTVAGSITFGATPLTQVNTTINSVFQIVLVFNMQFLFGANDNLKIILPPEISVNKTGITAIFGEGWAGWTSGTVKPLSRNDGDPLILMASNGAYPTANQGITLTISGLVLFKYIIPMVPIYLISYTSDGNIVCESSTSDPKMVIQTTPGGISNILLQRLNSNIVGQKTQVKITFTPDDPFSKLAAVIIDIPLEQINVTDSVIALSPVLCTLTTKNSTYKTLNCNPNDGYYWYTGSYPESSKITISITLDNVYNPFVVFPPTNNIGIVIFNSYGGNMLISDARKASVESKFGTLTPNTISDFSYIITGSRIAGDLTTCTASFTIVTPLAAGSKIRINFPDDFLYNQDNSVASVAGYNSITVALYDGTTGSIKSITINDAVSADGLPASTKLTFSISNIRNAPHTVPVLSTSIIANTLSIEGYMVNTGVNINTDFALTPNKFSPVNLQLTQPVITGATETASLVFTLSNKIPKSNGFIKITLPSTVSLAQKEGNPITCEIQTGGISDLCQVNSLKEIMVTLSSLSKLGNSGISRGASVTIVMNYLLNPGMIKESESFTIYSYLTASGGQEYGIDLSNTGITVLPTQAHVVNAIKIERNERRINNATNLTFTLTPFNLIPPTGNLYILIPQSIEIINPDTNMEGVTVRSVLTGGIIDESTNYQRQASIKGNNLEIIIPQFCSAQSGCPAKTEFKFAITGLKNPSEVLLTQTEYIILKTQDKSGTTYYDIDQYLLGSPIPEISTGDLQSVTIRRDLTNIMASPVSFVFEFTINDQIANDEGLLFIFPSPEMIFKISGSLITCSISTSDTDLSQQTIVECDSTATLINVPQLDESYISIIKMSLKCPNNKCPVGLRKRVIISNIVSSYRTLGNSAVTLKTVHSASNGVVDAATIDGSTLTALSPKLFDPIQLKRSAAEVDSIIDLVIPINTNIKYEAGYYINVKIYEKVAHYLGNGVTCMYKQTSADDSSYSPISCTIIDSLSGSFLKIKISDACSGLLHLPYCPSGTSLTYKISGFSNTHSIYAKNNNEFVEIAVLSPSTSAILQASDSTITISPDIIKATISVSSLSISNPKAGLITSLDFVFQASVAILSSDTITLSFDSPFIYATQNTKCYRVANSIEAEVPCIVTNHTQYKYLQSIALNNFCPCDKSVPLLLRIKQLKNLLSVIPYTGLLSILVEETLNSNDVAFGSYQLLSVALLSPADLKQVTFVRSTPELAAIGVTFSVNFTLTAAIQDEGKVKIKLPNDQAVFVAQKTSLCTGGTGNAFVELQCQIAQDTVNSLSIISITDYCSTPSTGGCSENSKISINIKGDSFKNPSYLYVGAQKPQITTEDSSGNPIHSLSGIDISPSLQIQGITIQNPTIDNCYTNGVAGYSILISTPNVIQKNSILIITFPAMMMKKRSELDQSPNCYGNKTAKTCQYEYDSNGQLVKVTLTDLWSVADGQPNTQLNITISNILNPTSAVTFSGEITFIIAIPNENKQLISNNGIYDISNIANIIKPTKIITATVTRGSDALNVINQLTLSFQNINQIPNDGRIVITIPQESANLTIESNSLQSKSTCSYKNTNNDIVSLSCTIVYSPAPQKQFIISFPQFCDSSNGCSPKSTIAFTITNVVNPTSLRANFYSRSISITTYTSEATAIDEISNNLFILPVLVAPLMDNILFDIPSKEAGSDTEIDIYFVPRGVLTSTDGSNSNPSVYLGVESLSLDPSVCGSTLKAYLVNNGVKTSVDCAIELVTGSNVPKVIKISNICTNSCPSNVPISLSIPYRHYRYVKAISGNIEVYSKDGEVDTAYGTKAISVTLTSGSITDVEFNADSCSETGHLCEIAILKGELRNGISKNGGIVSIMVPQDFDLSSASCTAVVNGITLSKCLINTNSETAIESANQDIIPGQTLEVNYKKIKMPISNKPTSTFSLQSFLVTGGTKYSVDKNNSYIFVVKQISPFYGLSISRTNTTLGAESNFTLSGTFELWPASQNANVFVTLTFAINSEIILNNDSVDFLSVTIGNSLNSPIKVSLTANVDRSKSIQLSCSSSINNCGDKSKSIYVSFKGINNGFISTLIPTIDVSTSLDQIYFMQKSLSRIPVSPPLSHSINVISISRLNLYYNTETTLRIAGTLPFNHYAIHSILVIELPLKALLLSQVNTIRAITSAQQQLSLSVQETENWVTRITLQGICSKVDSCALPTIDITGLLNPGTNEICLDDLITITSKTSDGYIISQSSLNATLSLKKLTPIILDRVELLQIGVDMIELDARSGSEAIDNAFACLFSFNMPFKDNQIIKVNISNSSIGPIESSFRAQALLGTSKQQIKTTTYDINNITIIKSFDNSTREGVYGLYLLNLISVPIKTLNLSIPLAFNFYIYNNTQVFAYKENIPITLLISSKANSSINQSIANNASCANNSQTPNLQGNSCVDQCSLGYFNYFKFCISCYDPNCLSCDSREAQSCSKCKGSYYINNGKCVGSCETVSPMLTSVAERNVSVNLTRQIKTIFCQQFIKNKKNSTNNNNTVNSTNGTAKSNVTEFAYYIIPAHCARKDQCSNTCGISSGSCSQDTTYCVNCSHGSVLVPGKGKCVVECDKGYYLDEISKTCLKCRYDCESCLEGGNCTKCISYYVRYLDPIINQCQVACPSSTYINDTSGLCAFCSASCQTCSGPSPSMCLSCYYPFYLYKNECVSECPPHYKQSSNTSICEYAPYAEMADIWQMPVTIIGLVVLSAVAFKIISIFSPAYFNTVSLHSSLYSLFTMADTTTRVLLVIDLFLIRNTTIFTFALANILANSISAIIFETTFFEAFAQKERVKKKDYLSINSKGKTTVSIITYLSYIFGHNFLKILTSGYLFKPTLNQQYKLNPEYINADKTMSNYVAVSNLAQIAIYGAAFSVGSLGIATCGISLNIALVGLHAIDLLTGYGSYGSVVQSVQQR